MLRIIGNGAASLFEKLLPVLLVVGVLYSAFAGYSIYRRHRERQHQADSFTTFFAKNLRTAIEHATDKPLTAKIAKSIGDRLDEINRTQLEYHRQAYEEDCSVEATGCRAVEDDEAPISKFDNFARTLGHDCRDALESLRDFSYEKRISVTPRKYKTAYLDGWHGEIVTGKAITDSINTYLSKCSDEGLQYFDEYFESTKPKTMNEYEFVNYVLPILATAFMFYLWLISGRRSGDTFGDARWADAGRDAPVMRDILGEKGVALGVMLSGGSSPALYYQGPQHLLTVAISRSGKGVAAIVPNLLTIDRSVVCIDPKGENAAITARRRRDFGPVYLLNPFNEHGLGTARFNPLAHLSIDHPNVVADVAGIAEALVVAPVEESGASKHFNDSARALLKAIILHLVATKGGAATLPDMRAALTQPASDFEKLIFDMIESPHPVIRELATQFENKSKEIDSIISTARTHTEFLSEPAFVKMLGGTDFVMLDLKERPTSVFIILPSRYLQAYARFMRLIVVAALDQLQSRAGGVRTLFMLDEFNALGHLSAVQTAIGQAAGFNVQLWPFLQDLNQLKSLYKDNWESFIANSGVVQWFTPADMFTAEYLSKRLGQETIETLSESRLQRMGHDKTVTKGETGRTFQTPYELMRLPPDKAILTLRGLSYGIVASRLPYYVQQIDPKFTRSQRNGLAKYQAQFQGRYDPNPYHPNG